MPMIPFRALRPFVLVLSLLAGPLPAQVMPDTAVSAIAQAGAGDFPRAYQLADGDAVMTDLVTWMRLRQGGAPFGDYAAFLAARPDWPDADRLRERAEEALPKTTASDAVLAWFGDRAPATGEGAVRLAEALIRLGRLDDAKAVLAHAWVELRLTEDGHKAMIEAFPDVLAPHHAARADALLWRWRTQEAQWLLPHLAPDQAALVEARVAHIRKTGKEDAALAAVPEALRDTPGLVYDRYNWLADLGRRTEAVALLRARSTSAEALGEPFRWSGWRRSLARWEMREGRPQVAYELATRHFLTDGSAFADLEWLAGYLSLTYLDAPEQALAHFDAARGAVDSPISVARAEYWRGRALDALGQPSAEAYAAAAEHQTAFYGLLASEKIGKPLDPALTGAGDARDWRGAAVLQDDLVRAGITLLEAGERGLAVPFFVALGEELGADDLSRLGAALAEIEEPYFEVLLGKTAVARGLLVPSVYFPLHPLAEMDLPAPPALSLSIARRESEFNAGVGSPVGALGLMQLMPATAEEVAGLLGLPYSKPRLTGDWEYNARLGAEYLSMLEAQFGPSPVQIAAGYNAGPSRPEIWMDERGDPRTGAVDVVDWIEHIPFRETRNYVMRVTESIPVYEARLTGQTGPVAFTALLTGKKPLVRPQSRPAASAVADAAAGPESPVTADEAPERSPRPQARPDR